MVEQKSQPKKISIKSTKHEMLEAYSTVLKQLQEKKETEVSPEEKFEEKKKKETVGVAEALSSEGAVRAISNLKLEIGKMLTQISDRLEGEVDKFKKIQEAIGIKEKELQEFYEIERSAATLAALVESQNQRRQQFESEMTIKREELNREIQNFRDAWEKERKDHEASIEERNAAEKKSREREKEEFLYAFRREQQLARDRFEDEKEKLEREIQLKREEMEKELIEREKVVAEREGELIELRNKVNVFPKELETTLDKAIKDTTERIRLEARSREELLNKEFDGERNVLTTRIESLEKTTKEQGDQIARLSQQLEKAYQKVQDIAVKAVEGSSNLKSIATLQEKIAEQTRRQSQEK